MGKDLRNAWLLLLVRNGSSYGYELHRDLADRALAVDAAVMYRSLREMESDGLIASRWEQSEVGPQRRVYDITPAGGAELARLAATVTVARHAQSRFLAAYEPPTDDT